MLSKERLQSAGFPNTRTIMSKGKIRIGTSGWHYTHWKGPFYPKEMGPARFLSHYVRHFQTVEINNSFYRLPEKKTFSEWKSSSPARFLFSVKASRYITHVKKLKDPKAPLQKFFTRAQALEKKMGPILFQLPPNWKVNSERLENFLKALPPRKKYAFEFRDPSWHNEEIYFLLKKYRAAFCIYDFDRYQSPKILTTNFTYIRLHGPKEAYRGQYSYSKLSTWAKNFREWSSKGKDIYCYFDNDEAAYAVKDALRLQKMLHIR